MLKSSRYTGIALIGAVATVAACQASTPSASVGSEGSVSRAARGNGSAAAAQGGDGAATSAGQKSGALIGNGGGALAELDPNKLIGNNGALVGAGGASLADGNVFQGAVSPNDRLALGGFATGTGHLQGVVKDALGKPVAGATVIAGGVKATTDANGQYSLDVPASAALNVKVVANGFVLRDSTFPLLAGQGLSVDISVVPADKGLTKISALTGGKVVSADGRAELIFGAGALSEDATVRVTWLNGNANLKTPAAFRITQADEPAGVVADDTAPTVTEINQSDLPGPLETTAYGDRKFFSPVSFADVAMSAPLAEGKTATLRMAVSDEVLKQMLDGKELTEADLGQDMYPCFSWNADASTWDKPALSKIEKDENGKYWFVYTVRSNNMTVNAAAYRAFQIGDTAGQARVSLMVGGGRQVVDGTFTYGALIERSSDPAFDWHGVSFVNGKSEGVTMAGGTDWTNTGGNYRATNRTNLVRPSVKTQNYTGTTYGQVLGSENFDKWDRNGMFQLGYGPGDKFEINPPAVYGVAPTPAKQTGTTSTAAKPYLPAELANVIKQNVTQTQTIPATYLSPFYYNTDANLTVNLSGDIPTSDGTATIVYTLDGGSDQTLTSNSYKAGSKSITFSGIPRNAAAKPRAFVLKEVTVADAWSSRNGGTASIPVGGTATVSATLSASSPK